MKKSTILYIGKNLDILKTVVRVINANENWFAIGASNDIEAQENFIKYEIEVVLLGAGITYESESMLRSFFTNENPKAIVVQHYGGGSGLLMSEINLALVEYNEKRECFSK
ncbi:MAG: Mg2+/Co2+ transporter CorC [Flavobacteriales bacterium]|jgi:Mg2+/Co2+ transporter CorC